MRRGLLVNWHEEHLAVRDALEAKEHDPATTGDTGRGWSYVTFFTPGTPHRSVLFDIDKLEELARSSGFYLPAEVIGQHNKIVLSALSADPNPSRQLFGLGSLLQNYAKTFDEKRKYPHHGFYGKMGGFFERPEKGRVLVIYATSDEALLEIEASLQQLLPNLKIPGVTFSLHLSNGLSDIPRMLDGFNDPDYRRTGATHYRITDPGRFETLLTQARSDYHRYLFQRPGR